MYCSWLALTSYRNYRQLRLDLQPGVTVLCGENAQGKTNILEALVLLSTTRPIAGHSERDCLHWDADPRFARVLARVRRGDAELEIECILAEVPPPPSAAQSSAPLLSKRFKVNGAARRAGDVLGQLATVLFSPDDLQLVTGSPADRRRHLDITLCQLSVAYLRALQEYQRILTQRNALLKHLREGRQPVSNLAFWDQRLVACGAPILRQRAMLLSELNDILARVGPRLSGGHDCYEVRYQPAVRLDDQGAADEQFALQLEAHRSREVQAGMTLVGPHRDDYAVLVNAHSAQAFGSRAQQRTASLGIKLAELSVMQQRLDQAPVLLLDDVFSELDAHRREAVGDYIESVEQVLLTTSDNLLIPPRVRERATTRTVRDGTIEQPSEAMRQA